MSIVGPRPTLRDQVERYTPEQRRRLRARPGITGLAQISGRSTLPWSQRIVIDVHYVDNWSLRLDLAIMLRTIPALLRKDETYPGGIERSIWARPSTRRSHADGARLWQYRGARCSPRARTSSRAVSSAGEHSLHTRGVTGSIPVLPIGVSIPPPHARRTTGRSRSPFPFADRRSLTRVRPNRSIPDAAVVPVLIYPDVRAAVDWLTAAFGFSERVRIGEAHRSQLRAGEGAVIIGDVRGRGAHRGRARSRIR